MLSPELRAVINQLELTTRKLVSGPLMGDWRSTIKGSGYEFHQLREYAPGDDIRFVDWKASARTNQLLVRQYLEDRNRLVYLVVDGSASMRYGLHKEELIKQLAACLAFMGLQVKDAVGLLLFTRQVELLLPPRHSRVHIWSLVQRLFTYEPQCQDTVMAAPLDYLARLKGRRAIVCLLTDGMAPFDSRLLARVARMHDLRIFRCLDPRELEFPAVGGLMVEDRESGEKYELKGSIDRALSRWHRQQKELFISMKIPLLDLVAGQPFTGPLVKFLRQRIEG